MPCACPLVLALAWIERNRSAPSRLAIAGALGQRDELVGPAREDHLDAAAPSAAASRGAARRRGTSSASLTPLPCRAGIVAAVARIDDDARDAEPQLTRDRDAAGGVVGRWRRGRSAPRPFAAGGVHCRQFLRAGGAVARGVADCGVEPARSSALWRRAGRCSVDACGAVSGQPSQPRIRHRARGAAERAAGAGGEPPRTSLLWLACGVAAGGTRARTLSVIAAAATAAGTRTQSITRRYGL